MKDLGWWFRIIKGYFPKWTTWSIILFLFLFVVCVITILLLKKKIQLTRLQTVCLVMLCAYVLIVLFSTLITRKIYNGPHLHLMPFRIFTLSKPSARFVLREGILNIILFIPIGLLLPLSIKHISWKHNLVISFTFSLIIEVLQFITKRGTFETDDLILNTLGAVVGYAVVSIIRRWRKRRVRTE